MFKNVIFGQNFRKNLSLGQKFGKISILVTIFVILDFARTFWKISISIEIFGNLKFWS